MNSLRQLLSQMAPALLVGSAFLVGFFHSLAPGHWLPVVLTARSRKWKQGQIALGALVAAAGHIGISLLVALTAVGLGATVLASYEEQIEHYAGWGLVVFGILFAAVSWRKHSSCNDHDHGHHGPELTPAVARRKREPYWFLLSVGLAPCVAVIPVIVAASGHGPVLVLGAVVGFIVGVLAAFLGASLLVARGLVELDHPWLEHHDDFVTGIAVAILGVILLFIG